MTSSNHYSLDEFQTRPQPILAGVTDGSPATLTVDGVPTYVVQDLASYQAMLDELNSTREFRKGLEKLATREARPEDDVFQQQRSSESCTSEQNAQAQLGRTLAAPQERRALPAGKPSLKLGTPRRPRRSPEQT